MLRPSSKLFSMDKSAFEVCLALGTLKSSVTFEKVHLQKQIKGIFGMTNTSVINFTAQKDII